MGRIIATITLENNYGHPGNRPSTDAARRKLTKAIEDAMKKASDIRMKTPFAKESELADWSFTAIKVE